MGNENSMKHVKEFLVVRETMRIGWKNEEALKLKVFPFHYVIQANIES